MVHTVEEAVVRGKMEQLVAYARLNSLVVVAVDQVCHTPAGAEGFDGTAAEAVVGRWVRSRKAGSIEQI